MFGLVSQSHGRTVKGPGLGQSGSDLWISDNGATHHITYDPRNIYMIGEDPT